MKIIPVWNNVTSLPLFHIFLIVLLTFGVQVSSKRGCSSYGHSCFGGHGKRSHDNGIELFGLKYINPGAKLNPRDVINYDSTGPYQIRESYKPFNKNAQIVLRKLVSPSKDKLFVRN